MDEQHFKKKAVVTGGAGFLGSHLCDKLITEGYEVVCIDNLITGSEENISHLKDNPKFTFINRDIAEDVTFDFSFDELYHLASPASPSPKSDKSYHKLAFETMQVNTQGTWKLANRALENNAKFLFASTSEAYGDPLVHPQVETYHGNVSPTGPRSVYDEAKRFGETITAAFVRSKKLNGRIIRIFNTYGPRMAIDDGRAICEFITCALKNEPIVIYGDGSATRSFCYVSDLIEGIYQAMQKGEAGEIYNIGNPIELTILELANMIKEKTNSISEIIHEPKLEDDPAKRRPDISKATEKLGFSPKVSLEEGLDKTIEYFKEKIKKT